MTTPMLRNRFIIGSVLPRSPSDSLHPSIAQSNLSLPSPSLVLTVKGVLRHLTLAEARGALHRTIFAPPATTGYARYELYTPHPNYGAQCPPVRVEPLLEGTDPSWHDRLPPPQLTVLRCHRGSNGILFRVPGQSSGGYNPSLRA